MIKWAYTADRLTGFTYYPTLEIVMGVFFILAAFALPILFVYYNSISIDKWDEIAFCVIFFVFFAFLGKSLANQSMHMELKENNFVIKQDMHLPETIIEFKPENFYGIDIIQEKQNNNLFHVIVINAENGNYKLYKSVSKKEIDRIHLAILRVVKDNLKEN